MFVRFRNENFNKSHWRFSHKNPCQCSPWRGKLHMSVKKTSNFRGGRLPALDSGPDQPLPLLVPYDLHQAGVPLVDVFLQRSFQQLCGTPKFKPKVQKGKRRVKLSWRRSLNRALTSDLLKTGNKGNLFLKKHSLSTCGKSNGPVTCTVTMNATFIDKCTAYGTL